VFTVDFCGYCKHSTVSDRCFLDIGTIGPVEEIVVDNSLQGKVYHVLVFCVCRIRHYIRVLRNWPT